MSGLMRHLTGGWRRPRSLIVAAAIAAFSAGRLVAWAAWSSQGNGPRAAKSLSMPRGNTATVTVTHGGPTASATSAHSAGRPSAFGEAVTFPAPVTPAPPANEPSPFTEAVTPLAGGPLAPSGSAPLVTAPLSVATHTISASYA